MPLNEIEPHPSLRSPNAEEALSLLSLPLPPSRSTIEQAADIFLNFGIGRADEGFIVIRSGGLGAYVKSKSRAGEWVVAYWSESDKDKVVDVTGWYHNSTFRTALDQL